eukprot:CAMPEP_0185458978 /NCGR_PEP_ID=MMETSP1365-20130426/83674_1 /TAXON_ID=38817 /ORGANISM="Gephyrocapsa oceanica, Strain RCC1303" /LENGTH=37 /DNA_ID= /DNA_START= /DNA_END= /DNA_ORIENTATION=
MTTETDGQDSGEPSTAQSPTGAAGASGSRSGETSANL